MLFNSFAFLLFFPLVTVLYFLLPHRWRWAWLLGASCLFYMYFIPKYILILIFTIVVDYFAGLLIEQAAGPRRKLLLLLSLAANVGVLAGFKYFNFLSANLQALARCLDWHYSLPTLEWLLPVGLSFHTFQAMSYTIEVYRGRQKAERHFGIYALYVMFYPQLVAGPIERPQNLLHQFREVHSFDYQRISSGLKLMAWGLFTKTVVADNLAVLVNKVYAAPAQFQGPLLLAATVLFAFQIFCDFSGYSDIAIGAARVMGFQLMRNFNGPYTAQSIAEFWQRWHVSLSTWFKDYLYITLGGNRVAFPRWCVNIFLVFLVSGLWHGANWTYVIWGALHGLFLIVGAATLSWRQHLATLSGLVRLPRLHAGLKVLTTFSLVCLGWIFFRASSVHDAWLICCQLGTGWGTCLQPALMAGQWRELGMGPLLRVALLGGVVAALVQAAKWRPALSVWLRGQPWWLRWSLYYALVGSIFFLHAENADQFIYFQF
ncbi:MAG TPA: MBOAT family O-acyltransferase [Bacillota bacterium]|nr:MBOAT family O-acyltransferase [Bacillota bacterium]